MTKIVRIVGITLGALLLLFIIAAIATVLTIRASLPQLDGQQRVGGLKGDVSITRDTLGTASISAESSLDVIRGLGFVHAQERFFEMDLARRSAAGELSALLGPATIDMDKAKRAHRLRTRALADWNLAGKIERDWFTAYAEGVNAGLSSLTARPWQYLVLRAAPEAWRPEDSLLVIAEMYVMMQQGGIDARLTDIKLRALLGDRIFDWLRPIGGAWDATLDGQRPEFPSLPGPSDIDTRVATVAFSQPINPSGAQEAASFIGSNNWAVGSARTKDGRAILADDMHLGLTSPGIWFRAQLNFTHKNARLRATGVTLPGVPQLVAGSNGHVAWGFTNSYGQWFDWVKLPKSPSGADFQTITEKIAVKGQEPVELIVKQTGYGTLMESDKDHHYVLSWSLYRPGALVNRVAGPMVMRSVDEMLGIAAHTPTPHQNILVADREGNIAWTIIGRIEDRATWAVSRGRTTDPAALPKGWLAADQYPILKNPQDGLLWTANGKQLGGKGGEIIGDGGFDLGARGSQIRDRLREKPSLSETDLYAIQLDRESRFLKRWATLIQSRVAAVPSNSKIQAIGRELAKWNGAADVDQTGHRIVRAIRESMQAELWEKWLRAKGVPKDMIKPPEKSVAGLSHDGRFEYAAWQAIEARAAHLLPKPYSSWEAYMDAHIESTYDALSKLPGGLENATWGERNRARIQHPFSRAMPFLSPYLDRPNWPQAGDNHMPRVAAPRFGASQRLVVSPAHENEGILTVAGGQSGHPLSPFFGAGHREWHEGTPTPFLPGPALHTLTLTR